MSAPISAGAKPDRYPSLSEETRSVLPTDCAAYHLNRKPKTLLHWACYENGPIRPVRIVRNLGWRTADIRRLVGASE